MSTPPALEWSVANCPIGRTMEILGESGTVIVLREIFNGVRRFDLMQRAELEKFAQAWQKGSSVAPGESSASSS